MGMDDDWDLEDIPPDAGTPNYFDHPHYKAIRKVVGEIRGEYIAHEYNNCIVAHRALHLLLNDELVGNSGKLIVEAAKGETK